MSDGLDRRTISKRVKCLAKHDPRDCVFCEAAHFLAGGEPFMEMRDAMQEFVDRCDNGEVLSKYTYAKFKEILDRAG
jgi:hypothetical protein